MTEIQFAKQFLTTLDSKNNKYQPDHVFDPKTFATRTPYTLPKLSSPPHPLPPKTNPSQSAAPGSQPSTTSSSPPIKLTLKSTRNPTFTLHLTSTPSNTTIASLKSHIQSILPDDTISPEKIKILYNKKPIPATKPSVRDVLEDNKENEVEFTVMVMGGAGDPSQSIQTIDLGESQPKDPAADSEPKDITRDGGSGSAAEATKKEEASDPVVQPGEPSGKEVLSTAEFWDDLQGFLEQRLRDTSEASRLRGVFEKALKG